jgi:CheY-like chemotaxis protein
MTTAITPLHIMLVEDNDGDIFLTREALEETKFWVELLVKKDGQQAIDFLSAQTDILSRNLPDLILLDVNLPIKNGHEVLKYIRATEHTKQVPVIMFTTSSSQKDINLSYANNVNCFITKPTEANDFLATVASIQNFWISIVQLPKHRRA